MASQEEKSEAGVLPAAELPLSVIIPVYNEGHNVSGCVEMLLGQSFQDFEIIFVDDGSEDNTVSLIQEAAKQDEKGRIKLLRQKHQYAGEARNRGLRVARGMYVLFLDCDDCFDERMLEMLWKKADGDHAEICLCGGWVYDVKRGVRSPKTGLCKVSLLPEETPFSPEEIAGSLFNFSTSHVFNKMYSRAFLETNHLLFPSYRIAEDTVFTIEAFCCAQRITYVDERLIQYRINTGENTCDSISEDILMGYRALCEAKRKVITRGKYGGDYKRSFVNRALGNILAFESRARDCESFVLWFNAMKNEALHEFELDNIDDDEIDKKENYKRLVAMRDSESALEYLHYRYSACCETIDDLRADLRSAKTELKHAKRKVGKMKNSRWWRLGERVRSVKRQPYKIVGHDPWL